MGRAGTRTTWLRRGDRRHELAVTTGLVHVRDAIHLRRVMGMWTLALLPCALAGACNVGHQALRAYSSAGPEAVPESRIGTLARLGLGSDPSNLAACLVLGLTFLAPVVGLAWATGRSWELGFARGRGRTSVEGMGVLALLFSLSLPPTIPWWQVILGMSVGVVLGREVFGGLGMNFVHPVLVGWAFLFFAYPGQMAGDAAWIAIDGHTGATPLALAREGGVAAIEAGGVGWWQSFLGSTPGAMGETSTLACILGAGILLAARLFPWRVVLGIVLGTALTTLAVDAGGAGGPGALPWHWHWVLGGLAYGAVFLATEPASCAQTRAGHWVFGLLIGTVAIVIRTVSPSLPEGILFAILFASVLAPTVDHVVVRLHVRRRRRRGS